MSSRGGLNHLSFATLWRDGPEISLTTNKSLAELDRPRRETITRDDALASEMRGKEGLGIVMGGW